MTKEEIIKFTEQLIEINPRTFSYGDDTLIIEDNYIFIPSIELRRDPNTDEWIPT